jgi:anti-sigma factor RsiW
MSDNWTPKLDLYLDGELSAEQMRALDAHLRSCSSCAADLLNRVQLKRAVQSAGWRYRPSAELRERVRARISGRERLVSRFRLASMAAVVSLLIIAVCGAYLLRQRSERERTFSELVDLHIATLASANPLDVISSDRHTVKPWFQGKIPFSFTLPELENSEFVLAGGRVSYLEQTPGAQLMYQIRKHQISVFIFPNGAVGSGFLADWGPRRRRSFNAETWARGGLRYFVIADASREDIHKLSEMLKAVAGS